MSTVAQYSIPIIVVVLFLSVLIAGWLYSRNYIKVSPNEVAVFSGRARRLPRARPVATVATRRLT